MRRNSFRRLALKLYSTFGTVETMARFIVWIFGMFLALMTIITILPLLNPANRWIVLISLILFLIAGLIVFVRDIPRLLHGEMVSYVDTAETLVKKASKSNGMEVSKDSNSNEANWPAVRFAYEFIVPQYEMTERHL